MNSKERQPHSKNLSQSSQVHVLCAKMKFVLGTQNKAKIEAVKMAIARCRFAPSSASSPASSSAGSSSFGDRMDSDGGETDGHDIHEVVGLANIQSGVNAQPMSASETRQGALQRATLALLADPTATFGIGLEGGCEVIDGIWFECGWIAVVHRSGRCGFGSSARFQLDDSIIDKLKTKELAEVMDEMTGEKDVRSNMGAMGILTGGALTRAEAYAQGVIFAFAPFLSSERYWTVAREKNVVDLTMTTTEQRPAVAAATN